MRITEELLNNLFKEEGLRFTHDDEMRQNANYYWVASDSYPGVCLRVYAGAERGGNLVNRYSVNDQYVSGILCLDSDILDADFDKDEVEFEFVEKGSPYEKYLMSVGLYKDHDLYLNGTPCVAYVDQENVTDYGYLDFADDILPSHLARVLYNDGY